MHEKQKSSSILPGEADNSEPLVTSGDIPAQTSAEDPKVSPAPTGSVLNTANTTMSSPHATYYHR